MIQPGSQSAISIVGSDFKHGSKIRFASQALVTTYGSQTGLTALVPLELYSKPGVFQVTVENPDGEVSNSQTFSVLESKGAVPEINHLQPDSAIEGKGFNVQPNGISALGVDGSNFLPGATIEFDGQPLVTTFGSTSSLTGAVPAELLRRVDVRKIVIRNPDGKRSNPAEFRVQRAR